MVPPRRLALLACTIVCVEALATALDLLVGQGAAVSAEERYNAHAGAQIACGHLDRVWDLQYKAFCGGCTVEALLAALVFRVAGPTVLAWKAVPAALHLLLTAAGTALAGRMGGARGAVAFALLVLGAPAFWRDLSLTGFGNHAESSAIVLLAALLADSRRPGILLVAGATAGLAVWFCPTAAHALPALLAVSALAGWRGVLAFSAGLPAGLAPALLYRAARPDGWGEAVRLWTGFQPAPLAALPRWLWTDLVAGGQAVLPAWTGVLTWGALWTAGLGGAALAARAAASRKAPAVGLFPVIALAGLVAAWILRFDLWDDNPAIRGFDPFNLRYRAPLFPLLALGAATAAARGGGKAFAVLLVVVAIGAGDRVARWTGNDAWGTGVYDWKATPDRTVPVGSPPQRLPRAQGRPADIAAAGAFLEGHADPLPDCRLHHVFEYGRRTGLARAAGGSPVVEAPSDPAESAAFAAGIERSLAETPRETPGDSRPGPGAP